MWEEAEVEGETIFTTSEQRSDFVVCGPWVGGGEEEEIYRCVWRRLTL
jgi:hypothetical protein